MLPMVVGLAGLLYSVRIWIPPSDMLMQIVEDGYPLDSGNPNR